MLAGNATHTDGGQGGSIALVSGSSDGGQAGSIRIAVGDGGDQSEGAPIEISGGDAPVLGGGISISAGAAAGFFDTVPGYGGNVSVVGGSAAYGYGG